MFAKDAPFLRCMQNLDGGVTVWIFYTDQCMDLLLKSDCPSGDGMHRVPKGFMQLYTLHCFIGKCRMIPCVYALCTHKSTLVYEVIADYIQSYARAKNMPVMWTNIRSDFEDAFIGAFTRKFPGIVEVNGCFFHFCQAVFRHLSQLGLKVCLLMTSISDSILICNALL